jgi:hypothetical protein
MRWVFKRIRKPKEIHSIVTSFAIQADEQIGGKKSHE